MAVIPSSCKRRQASICDAKHIYTLWFWIPPSTEQLTRTVLSFFWIPTLTPTLCNSVRIHSALAPMAHLQVHLRKHLPARIWKSKFTHSESKVVQALAAVTVCLTGSEEVCDSASLMMRSWGDRDTWKRERDERRDGKRKFRRSCASG